MSTTTSPCHACGGPALSIFPAFAALPRVTSDCRPWPGGGQLAVCESCGLVQKPVDAVWRSEAARIYGSYALYHQTAGQTEQVIFDQTTGSAAPRSELLLRALRERLPFPAGGRLLDLGCGTGPTLLAFSRLMAGWQLFGYDPHLPDRARVAAIPGVQEVFEGALGDLAPRHERDFALVTAVHVLEHVADPLAFLRAAARLLAPNGLLVVQVPHFPDTPFDLVVADHVSHFGVETLGRLCRQAGLEPRLVSTALLPKEITLVAQTAPRSDTALPAAVVVTELGETRAVVERALGWLQALLGQAEDVAANRLGVFGTSIGGNWLQARLGERIDFFVDEDPGRAGSRHHERPVLRPDEIPPDGRVLMPLPPALATKVRARLWPESAGFVLPPGCSP